MTDIPQDELNSAFVDAVSNSSFRNLDDESNLVGLQMTACKSESTAELLLRLFGEVKARQILAALEGMSNDDYEKEPVKLLHSEVLELLDEEKKKRFEVLRLQLLTVQKFQLEAKAKQLQLMKQLQQEQDISNKGLQENNEVEQQQQTVDMLLIQNICSLGGLSPQQQQIQNMPEALMMQAFDNQINNVNAGNQIDMPQMPGGLSDMHSLLNGRDMNGFNIMREGKPPMQRNQRKRRKARELNENEKWFCPKDCGKFYRSTSTRSIQKHKLMCDHITTAIAAAAVPAAVLQLHVNAE